MNFRVDLEQIIKEQFDSNDIRYEADMDIDQLAAHYLEMLTRRVVPAPRRVHFSDKLNDTLGKLAQETSIEQREKALEAWQTVFCIRHLLVEGQNVTRFLSRSVDNLTFIDGLLWDFGMHHFHLNRKPDKAEPKFVKRSDYLLFAIITQKDAFFVDVRPHPKSRSLIEWARQDLIRIVHLNWPELIKPYVLRGQTGDVLTDKEKMNLRKKNVNHVTELGGKAVSPIGGGMASDGSSSACRIWADRLLHEIDQHQRYFDEHQGEVRSQLENSGTRIDGELDFRLVLLDSLNPSAEPIDSLREDRCLSRNLCRMGFVIVETITRRPIIVSIEEESRRLD